MNLSFLAGVAVPDTLHATVYLDTSRDHENAPHEIELRWREARDELAAQGADPATLEALDAAVADDRPRPGRTGRCLVAAAGGDLRFDRPLPAPPRQPGARWAPLPNLMPYLVQQPRTVPHVVAVVDRVGADLYAFGPVERPDLVRDETVTGEDFQIRKIHPGGWSSRHYEQRAENLWEQNAGRVAAEVDRLVGEVGAELVVAAGDVRARAALGDRLGSRSRDLLVELDRGGQSVGDDEDALADAVAAVVEERYARDRDALVDRYLSHAGNTGDQRDGLPATVEALREARVDTLLLRDDPRAGGTAYVGPEPTHLALEAATLTALGVSVPRPDRVDAALARALAGTD